MDRGSKERLIALIAWGSVITDAPLSDSGTRRLVLRPATPEIQARAAIEYETAYRSAICNGLLTEDEALDFFNANGHWTATDQQQMDGVQDDIHKLKRGLLDYLFQVEKLEQIRQTIRRAEKVLVKKWRTREGLLRETASRYALLAQQQFIIGRITHTEDGRPLWPTQDSFDACADISLIRHLVDFYYVQSRLSEDVVREISRTDPWRGRWVASKKSGQIFETPAHSWSPNQTDLVRWSNLYDMVFEAFERPSEQVINDDDLLDSWLIRQSDKTSEQSKKRETESLLQGVKSGGKGRQEVFVVSDRAGAQRVYELNDASSRRIVKQTQKFVQERGMVKETELPQSQLEMRMLATEEFRKAMGNK